MAEGEPRSQTPAEVPHPHAPPSFLPTRQRPPQERLGQALEGEGPSSRKPCPSPRQPWASPRTPHLRPPEPRPRASCPGGSSRQKSTGILLTWGKNSLAEPLKNHITSCCPRQVYKWARGRLGRNPTLSQHRPEKKGGIVAGCQPASQGCGRPGGQHARPPHLLEIGSLPPKRCPHFLGWGWHPLFCSLGRGNELSSLYSHASKQRISWADDGKVPGAIFFIFSERDSPL